MQKPYPLLELQDGEATIIAEWYSVAYDLQHVISASKLLVNMLQQSERDSTIVRSLWSSALISYVRCFASGRRAKLDKKIYVDLLGDPIGTHQYYKDTRDKHIAHPVNAFEEVGVGLLLDEAGNVCIGHLATFRICDDAEGVAQLSRLATFALQYVMSVIEPLENQALARFVKDPTLIASLRPLRIQPQGGAEAARAPREMRD